MLPAPQVECAHIVVLAARGRQDKAITGELGVSSPQGRPMAPAFSGRRPRRPGARKSTARAQAEHRRAGRGATRHRHQEYLRFLDHLDGQTPADRDVHLIVDNDAPHQHARVEAWLKKHPRFSVHYTPTSASWLNRVERFFRDLTARRVRAGVFRSVAALELAITDYIHAHQPAAQAVHLDGQGPGHPGQSLPRPVRHE